MCYILVLMHSAMLERKPQGGAVCLSVCPSVCRKLVPCENKCS